MSDIVSVFPPKVWPPAVVLDGHTYQLRSRSALAIVEDIAIGDWSGLFTGSLCDEDLMHIALRIADVDDDLDTYRLVMIGRVIAENVCGTSFEAARQLAASVVGGWFWFSAWCISHQMDVTQSSVHALIAASYAASLEVAEHSDDKMAVTKLNAKLWPLSDRTHTAADEAAIVAAAVAS